MKQNKAKNKNKKYIEISEGFNHLKYFIEFFIGSKKIKKRTNTVGSKLIKFR